MSNSNYLMVLAFLLASCDSAAEDSPSAEDGGTASCMCEPGLPGSKGEMGPAGPVGEQGAHGPVGETGAEGPAGPQGVVGPQGEAGPRGEQGEPGADGAAGPMGPQGEPGRNGIDGVDGNSCALESVAEGVRVTCDDQEVLIRHGEMGPQGAQGIPGEPGEVGIAGPQGEQGIAGREGRDLVRACPQNSESIVINGHLVYCYKKLVFEEPIGYAQCHDACQNSGLHLLEALDLQTICKWNPEEFNRPRHTRYVIGPTTNVRNQDIGEFSTVFLDNPSEARYFSSTRMEHTFCEWQTLIRENLFVSNTVQDQVTLSLPRFMPYFLNWLRDSAALEQEPRAVQEIVDQLPRGCLCGKRM
jgi:hypothetical protein